MSTVDAADAARAARTTLDELLRTEARLLAATLPPRTLDRLEALVAVLLDENTRLNLTRIVEPAAVARLHLLDALVALPIVDDLNVRRGVDIGAGGGIPGLALALARPAVRWTLIESDGRKAAALERMRDRLGLANVDVAAARVEDLGRDPSWRGRHDLATARACASLPVLAEYALPLLRVGGTLLAWKAGLPGAEIEAGGRAARRLGGGEPDVREPGAPSLGAHRFVLITKLSETPDAYPRRAGVPARRPLG